LRLRLALGNEIREVRSVTAMRMQSEGKHDKSQFLGASIVRCKLEIKRKGYEGICPPQEKRRTSNEKSEPNIPVRSFSAAH
jgi:hypothetical protein